MLLAYLLVSQRLKLSPRQLDATSEQERLNAYLVKSMRKILPVVPCQRVIWQ